VLNGKYAPPGALLVPSPGTFAPVPLLAKRKCQS
jgi:hypothetical protein